MSKKRLYLIDATAFCYRAFYALKGLSTSFGLPTNAIYGFINILNKILKEQKPDYLGICFDVSRDTFRSKKFAEYKMQRPPMPEGLVAQIPLIKQIVSAYNLVLFEKEGFEADDIIATLSTEAKKKGLSTVIVSSDKDILQLVDESTSVFSPYKDEGVHYDSKKVSERFGVAPGRIADIISLMGDSADNIPGVPGIGEKTAKDLIVAFGSIENLLDNVEKVKSEKIRQAIKDNIKQIRLNKELALLDKTVEVDFDLDKLKAAEPDQAELFKLFRYLEFKRLLKDLTVEPAHEDATEIAVLSDEQVRDIVGEEGELFLYGQEDSGFVFYAKNKFFKAKDNSKAVIDILTDPRIKKIGYDLKRIKISLNKDAIGLDGICFDVMIAAYLINSSKSEYSLEDIALDYLARPISKGLDVGRALELVVELRPKLESELKSRLVYKLFCDLEMPLVEVLADMELNGIKLDLGVLSELSAEIEKKLIKIIENIYEASGTQFNINSPKQLREILFEKLKLPVVKKSKTGPSTDEEVLRKLATAHELPALILEYRQLTKLKNTYIDTLPALIDKKTDRIHATFNQTGTETGRLSSSDPNLQNIPVKTEFGRRIRQAIIASGKENCLISCDYSQIELRVLAHLSKDQNLIEAFNTGLDIHKITASLVYGIEENDVTDQMREVAKRVNFGIVYGLTFYGLSRDLNIPPDEAQRFIDAYFLRYPGVKVYIQTQIEKAEKDGFVTTLLGRRRYIPEINNKNQGIRQFAQRQAVNTPIQGTASDLIKLAMIQIHKEIKDKNLKARMIMQIHDELVFDLPKKDLKDDTSLIRNRMENVLKLDVPVKVDIKMGSNWLEMEEVE